MTWAQTPDAVDRRMIPIIAPGDLPLASEPTPGALLPTAGWDRRLAQAISTIGSPPLVALAALASMAYAAAVATEEAAVVSMWAAAYLALAILVPFLYLVYLVRCGEVTDLDVQRREQRPRPLLVAIATTGVAWLVLQFGGAPLPLRVLAGGAWSALVLLAAITLRWKISIHCAAAAGLAVLLWGTFNISPALPGAGVAAIAWSRWRLQRHTWAQTAAGIALGSAVYWVALAAYLR